MLLLYLVFLVENLVGVPADLVFKWQNGVLIAPVNPRLSQVVRSTPLGVPCSELQ
jgi:hypothetical protein